MRKVLACAAFALLLGGCAHRKHVRVQAPIAPPVGYTETGIASWYGHPYHGRPAADGEIYDMETLVAAHRTLAFNVWVRVVNLENGKSVDVRIIDRGPFIDGRIIDLSHAAAGAIDMVRSGIAKVRIEVIEPPPQAALARPAAPRIVAAPPAHTAPKPAETPQQPPVPNAPPLAETVPPASNEPKPLAAPPVEPGPALYAVQVGEFRDHAQAELVRSQMQARYGAARLVQRPGAPDLWRVLVGAENSEADADALASRLATELSHITAFVVRLDAR